LWPLINNNGNDYFLKIYGIPIKGVYMIPIYMNNIDFKLVVQILNTNALQSSFIKNIINLHKGEVPIYIYFKNNKNTIPIFFIFFYFKYHNFLFFVSLSFRRVDVFDKPFALSLRQSDGYRVTMGVL